MIDFDLCLSAAAIMNIVIDNIQEDFVFGVRWLHHDTTSSTSS
jgi:hypothetical protein